MQSPAMSRFIAIQVCMHRYVMPMCMMTLAMYLPSVLAAPLVIETREVQPGMPETCCCTLLLLLPFAHASSKAASFLLAQLASCGGLTHACSLCKQHICELAGCHLGHCCKVLLHSSGTSAAMCMQVPPCQSSVFPMQSGDLQCHHSLPVEYSSLSSLPSQASCNSGCIGLVSSLSLDLGPDKSLLDTLPTFGDLSFESGLDSHAPKSPPIGLQLRKSESFLELINEHLQQANSAGKAS